MDASIPVLASVDYRDHVMIQGPRTTGNLIWESGDGGGGAEKRVPYPPIHHFFFKKSKSFFRSGNMSGENMG